MKTLLWFLFAITLWAQTGPPPVDPSAPQVVKNRIVVGTVTGADAGQINRALKSNGAGVHHTIPEIHVIVLDVPEQAIPGVMNSLKRRNTLFSYVERDPIANINTAVVPSDTDLAGQQADLAKEKFYSALDSLGAWDITTGSATVIIGAMDTGIDGSHPDLSGKVIGGWNFVSGVAIPAGANSDTGLSGQHHGTATAGIEGAATDNSAGIAGAGWLSPLMPLMVCSDSVTGCLYSDMASALIWATDHGAKVINISLAGSNQSSVLDNGVNYAIQHGVIVVAAAGNNNSSTCMYPACSPGVISVGATDASDVRCSFSNFTYPTVYAQGCPSIFTTQAGGTYGGWYGTSFSAPQVTGAIALALAVQPALKAADVKTLITNNSDTIAAGVRLNARKLVAAAQSFTVAGDSTPPVVAITTPANLATVSGVVSITGTATDDTAVTSISLYVGSTLIATAGSTSPYAFSWTSTTVADASYTITVKASDAAGNVGSASKSVTVSNGGPPIALVPPTATITSPFNGAHISRNVQVAVSSTSSIGVSSIQVFLDNVQLCNNSVSGTTATTTCGWNSRKAASGSHTIYAVAKDTAGNTGKSSVITVQK